ncbi:MAG: hypothetical protein M9897_10470 [Brumimicrobium sp.]|nr:hypothetical protein [Brumimicrobium sp.]
MNLKPILLIIMVSVLPKLIVAQTFDANKSLRLKDRYDVILNSTDKKRVKKLEKLLDSIQTASPQYIQVCNKCEGTLYYMVSSSCKRCRGAGTVKHNVCSGSAKITCPQCNRMHVYDDPVCLGTGKKACSNCKSKGYFVKDCKECLATGKVNCYKCSNSIIITCSHCRGSGHEPRNENLVSPQIERASCRYCAGTGREKKCKVCNSTGKATCRSCNGYKKVKDPCRSCDGAGYTGPCPTLHCKSGKLDCHLCDREGKTTCPGCKNGYAKCTGFDGICGDGTVTYKMECGFCNGFGKEIKTEP